MNTYIIELGYFFLEISFPPFFGWRYNQISQLINPKLSKWDYQNSVDEYGTEHSHLPLKDSYLLVGVYVQIYVSAWHVAQDRVVGSERY